MILMKNVKRVISLFITATILLCMFSVSASAASISVNLKRGSLYPYIDGYTRNVVQMEVNGKPVYCIQPEKSAPDTGTYTMTKLESGEKLGNSSKEAYNKALYYGFNGIGFSSIKSNGKTMKDMMDAEITNEYGYELIPLAGDSSKSKRYYAISHILVSYMYSGTVCDDGTNMTNYIPPVYLTAAKNLYQWLLNAPAAPQLDLYYCKVPGRQTVLVQQPIDKKTVNVQITKTSSNTAISDGNSCYSLKGAVYDVYKDESCKTKFCSITTDANGKGSYSTTLSGSAATESLTLYAKESKAPMGYALDKQVHKLSVKQESSSSYLYSATLKDAPQNDPVEILLTKKDSNGAPLEGAEFTIKYYDGYYKTEAELKDVKATRNWVLKTDDRGYTYLNKSHLVKGDDFYYATNSGNPAIPLGTITIQEIKAPENYKTDNTLYIQQITSDSNAESVSTFNPPIIPNEKVKGYVKVHKVDSTDRTPVPGAEYGLFSTADTSVEPIAKCITDSDGYGSFDIAVDAGTYYVKELSSPEGYILDTITYRVEINSENTTIETAAVLEVTDKPTSIRVTKVDENGVRLPNAKLQILDGSDETKIVDEWITDGTVHVIKGKVEIGKEYILREVSAPNGYVKAEDIRFTAVKDKTFIVTMVNKLTVTEITKTEADTNKPFAGATLTVTDKNGKVIDEWVSTEEPHIIKGLVAGETYTLVEAAAPDGYTISKPVTFTVNTDGSITKVVMANAKTITEITKTEITSNKGLAGATLVVKDKDGKVIDEWVSTEEAHIIKGLVSGATYTLIETNSPDGYTIAKPVAFTVNTDGSVTKVVMANVKTITEITKTEITSNKELAGATLTVTDKNGKVIDEWISTNKAHIINGLVLGETYTLTETKSPDGYTIAKPVTFTVNTDGSVTKVTMANAKTVTQITKTDITSGKELPGASLIVTDMNGIVMDSWISTNEPHIINGLVLGKTYVLTETAAPDGYTVAKSVTFTVNTDGSVTKVTMANAKTVTEILKVDAGTNKPLSGATLVVSDNDGNVIDEWVSTEEAHIIKGLVEGKTYTLTETNAPDGYTVAKPVTFTISTDGTVTKVTMADKKTVTEITKADATGEKELPGASLVIKDKDSNVIDEWVSTDEPHKIEGLVEGETYTLVETIAPDGYVVSNAIEFTVNNDGTVTSVVMKDDTTKYSFVKVDDKGEPVKNAVLQLLDKDGKIVDEWTTDGNPHILDGLLVVGETYTLHEKQAPEGYTAAKDYTFTVQNTAEVQEIKMIDVYKGDLTVSTPDTATPEEAESNTSSVQTGVASVAVIVLIAFAAFAVLCFFRRKSESKAIDE